MDQSWMDSAECLTTVRKSIDLFEEEEIFRGSINNIIISSIRVLHGSQVVFEYGVTANITAFHSADDVTR